MPFARHSGFTFSLVSIRQNAPAMSGIYGLSNAQGWIYIQATENIQSALVSQLRSRETTANLRIVTGFTFEVCDAGDRDARCNTLILELHPTVNERAMRF